MSKTMLQFLEDCRPCCRPAQQETRANKVFDTTIETVASSCHQEAIAARATSAIYSQELLLPSYRHEERKGQTVRASPSPVKTNGLLQAGKKVLDAARVVLRSTINSAVERNA